MRMTMRTLILVGASVRGAACSAARAGYEPYSIDLFADRDLAALGPAVKIARYPADFVAALAEAPSAPWMYTGGLENYPRVVDRLATSRALLGNRGGVLRDIRDPAQVMQLAREAGCQSPLTLFDGATLAGTDGQNQPSQSRWLVKPLRSSGGTAIRVATTEDVVRPPRGTYVQQYLDGDSLSAGFVAAGGRAMLLGSTKQLLGRDFGLSRPFLYVGSVGPISLSDEDRERLHALGNALAERFGLVGLFNVDFVRNEAGLWPLEVNPRYSASVEVLERTGGPSLVEAHIQACQVSRLPDVQAVATSRFAGKAVVYASAGGVVPKTLDDVVSDWNADSAWPGVADLPHVGERLRRGQPVVTIFADGDSLAQVEAELRRRVGTIERLLADS